MGKSSNTPFSAIPLRAWSDRRLSELHLRVLGIVSYHDRMSLMSEKGQGCWASSETMAAEIGGYNLSNVSTAISQLAKYGYLQVEQRPTDRRMKVYRVIFESGDNLPAGQTIVGSDNLPVGQTKSGDSLPGGKSSPEIVCPGPPANPQKTAKSDPQYISLSEERYSAEAGERNSAEAVGSRMSDDEKFADGKTAAKPSGGGRYSWENFGAEADAAAAFKAAVNFTPGLSPSAKLAKIDKAFSSVDRDRTRIPRKTTLRSQLIAALTHIARTCPDDAVGPQAERLCVEMFG